MRLCWCFFVLPVLVITINDAFAAVSAFFATKNTTSSSQVYLGTVRMSRFQFTSRWKLTAYSKGDGHRGLCVRARRYVVPLGVAASLSSFRFLGSQISSDLILVSGDVLIVKILLIPTIPSDFSLWVSVTIFGCTAVPPAFSNLVPRAKPAEVLWKPLPYVWWKWRRPGICQHWQEGKACQHQKRLCTYSTEPDFNLKKTTKYGTASSLYLFFFCKDRDRKRDRAQRRHLTTDTTAGSPAPCWCGGYVRFGMSNCGSPSLRPPGSFPWSRAKEPPCSSSCSVTSFVSWSLPSVDATRSVLMAEAAVGALEAAPAEIVTVEVAMEVEVEASVMDPLGRANHNKVQLHLL